MLFASFPMEHSTHINAETLVYGRYQVTLNQDIRTNKETLTAVAVGSPTVNISEVVELDVAKGWFRFGNEQLYQADWNRLAAANGDLSSLISHPIKDQPLPQAEQYLKQLENSNQ